VIHEAPTSRTPARFRGPLPIRAGEALPVLASAAYFFLVLFGYFLLRPVREAMGVQRSMDDLRWLFTVTCAVSLLVAVGFGGLVATLDRARFIRVGHLIVAACLGCFIVARHAVADDTRFIVGYVFYVWLSVVNLFLTSVFWAFMADIWGFEQGKRLFPIIAVGGTLGALTGSSFVWNLAERIGVDWQMALAAGCFLATVLLVSGLDRGDRAGRAARGEAGERPRPVGGNPVAGVLLLARSPYLLGAGLYVMFMTISSTLLYFTRADLVADAADELERRVSLFAQMDAWTQGATLFVQLFVTGRMMRHLGVGVTLAVLPAVTLAGFAVLAAMERAAGVEGWQLFGAVTAFSAVHAATRYAVARPSRETLFSVVTPEEKYKAKPVIDLFLYRGGDVAGAWLTGIVGLTLWSMLMLVLPLAALWGGMCVWLAAAQRRRAHTPDQHTQDGARTAPKGALG
jgi:AAA family ATP:ADP antiporter